MLKAIPRYCTPQPNAHHLLFPSGSKIHNCSMSLLLTCSSPELLYKTEWVRSVTWICRWFDRGRWPAACGAGGCYQEVQASKHSRHQSRSQNMVFWGGAKLHRAVQAERRGHHSSCSGVQSLWYAGEVLFQLSGFSETSPCLSVSLLLLPVPSCLGLSVRFVMFHSSTIQQSQPYTSAAKASKAGLATAFWGIKGLSLLKQSLQRSKKKKEAQC